MNLKDKRILKDKIILIILFDAILWLILIFLLVEEMWVEALLPFLLSLGMNFWNYPIYREFLFKKKDKK